MPPGEIEEQEPFIISFGEFTITSFDDVSVWIERFDGEGKQVWYDEINSLFSGLFDIK